MTEDQSGVEEPGDGYRPPYIAWGAWNNFLDKVGVAVPAVVDRGYIGGSGGHQSSVLGALRFFGLVDDDDRPTDTLELMASGDEQREETTGVLVRAAYAEAIALGNRATQSQLESWFRSQGMSGDTLRKAVSFFLRAATYSGVAVSPLWKASAATGTKTRRIVRRTAAAPETLPPVSAAPTQVPHGAAGLPGRVLARVHPAVITVLDKVPAVGDPWTERERTLFLAAFTNLLDLFHPSTAPADDTVADRDDA